MATTYIRDPSDWPMLLAGPMVRQVTPTSVSVFVALREDSDVTLAVFLPDGNALTSDDHTVPIGARLNVAVITLDGISPPLVPGVAYEYEVAFTAGGSGNLFTEGLLEGAVPLGYAPNKRPTFVLPYGRDHLRIAHASCRKPHGAGRDMLPYIDTLISDTLDDLDRRPQQLFLTGDQIYADDVAEGILLMANEAIDHLLGWSAPEKLPDLSGNYSIAHTDDAVLPERRTDLLDRAGTKGITHYAKNHLLFFGEWCAMYLLVWSDALWRPAQSGSSYSYDYPEKNFDRLTRGIIDTASESRNVLEFAESLPNVRRLLANVATYMIFDDHEVTDDWHLNKEVSNDLRTSLLGRHLMRNALAAYAVFQDWGNAPLDYLPSHHGRTILDACSNATPAASPNIVSSPSSLDSVLDLGDPPALVANQALRKRWDYIVECPEHFVLALDTRTWRGFPSDSAPSGAESFLAQRESAALINHLPDNAGNSAQRMLVDLNLTRRRSDQLLVVISPSPLIGHALAELIQHLLKLKEQIGSNAEWDNEAWGFHGGAYEAVLSRLAPHAPVVVLSGDVHYGFSQSSTYSPPSGAAPSRFIQLCSSAAKNESPKTDAVTVALLLPNTAQEELEDLEPDDYDTVLETMRTSVEVIGGAVGDFFAEQGQTVEDQVRAWLEEKAATELDDIDGIDELVRLFIRSKLERFDRIRHPIEGNRDYIFAGSENVETVKLLMENLGLSGESYVHRIALDDERSDVTRDDHFPSTQEQFDPSKKVDAGVLARHKGGPTVTNVGVVWFFTRFQQEVLVHDLFWRHDRSFVSPSIHPMLTRHQIEIRQPAHAQDSLP